MYQKFRQHITENFSFLLQKKVLIAISGGIDSVVLTHLLKSIPTIHIGLAHCNFKLRNEESDADETFVKKLGTTLQIATFTTQFETKTFAEQEKLSIQVSARELRYTWFRELAKEHQFDYIVTAHHADDNLETFIINLSRGTGLDGLTGIPKQNGNIIRPLLAFTQDEIQKFAVDNNIRWREDKSNTETKYLRNKIRHEIVPRLKELHPNFLTSFQKTTNFLTQSKQIVNDRIERISKEITHKEESVLKIDIQKIKTLSNPSAYLYQLLKPYNFTEWNDVFGLLNAQSGKYIATKEYRLLKNREFLLLLSTTGSCDNSNFYQIDQQNVHNNTLNLSIENGKKIPISKRSIIIDKNLVIFPLILRKWREGDVFYPTKMIGKKKVSKYFKDEKISLFEKENTWLLCNNNNEIIWVVGKRQDRRFAPSNSKNTIIINIQIPI